MQGALRAILGSFVIILAALIGVSVMDSFAQSQDGIQERVTLDAAELGNNGEFVAYRDGAGQNQTVYKTTGYAVNLTGANDSYIQSKQGFDMASDKNWTVSVWAYVDPGNENATMSAVSVDGRVVISYNGTSNEWVGWYYDESGANSYRVTAPTSGNETGNFTNVIVQSNGTHLSIYRNNTLGESKSIQTNSVADAPVTSTNWDGRLEEFRTFDEALNDSKRSELVNSPVEQQPAVSPTSRAMFDQPAQSTQLLLYTNTELEQSNVTYSSGFSAQVMDEGQFAAMGADYSWDEEGPKIAPIAGGELDGAPVAYADYDYATEVADIVGAWSNMLQLVALIPILAILAAIVSRLRV